MAERGGQPGNQNARRGRIWRDAIERALANRAKEDPRRAIDALAETLLRKCDEGDIAALKELGDRIEGKCVQPIAGENDGAPIVVVISERDAAA